MTEHTVPTHVCRIGDIDWSGADAPQLDDSECGTKRIEPWLSAILQAEHLALLIGNGMTTAVTQIAGGTPVSMQGQLSLPTQLADQIEAEAAAQAQRMHRRNPNIEDRLRVALTLEAAMRVVGNQQSDEIRAAVDGALTSLCSAVLSAERAVASATETDRSGDDHRFTPLGYLVAFLLSFASRTPTRDRLHLFTTNYDRLIEYACDQAGLRVVDRFVGMIRPRFRSSRLDVDVHYSPPGIRGEPRFLEGVVRFTKLHGSIDWRTQDGDVFRQHVDFGADPERVPSIASESLLVYPQSSKDVETAVFPYADLFRDFSAALCRPNSVVVTYGYGFGDHHINRVLADMLTLPSTHLVIITRDDSDSRIRSFIQDNHGNAQTSLLLGTHFSDLRTLTEHYLPRPAIDDITWRRARLLRMRATPPTPQGEEPDVDPE